jgi:hypothetical protein
MDRVGTIILWQWRAYWRRFARGRLSAGNQGFALIVTGLILVKYVQKLFVAASDLSQGKTSLFEALLTGILTAWFLAFLSRDQNSTDQNRTICLPLSLKELFVIRLAALLTSPFVFLILIGSIAICYPALKAPRPILGTIAALGFIVVSLFTGLTVSHLLSIAKWRRVLGTIELVTISIIALYVFKNPASARSLSAWSLPPMTLVSRAATAQYLSVALAFVFMLCLLIALSLAAAMLSFRATLNETSRQGAGKAGLSFGVPGRLGGLIAKDLKHFRRLLDVYLGILVAAMGCFYLITAGVASLEISIIFLTVVFLPSSPLAFNYFGLDSTDGLDRYEILPLTGHAIVRSKNFAFAVFALLQTVPLLLLIIWRLSFEAGLIAIIVTMSLTCAYLTWGNWMSVSHPVKMHFYRFSSSTSSLFDAMAGIVFSSSPGILTIYLLNKSPGWLALVPSIFGILYAMSLALAGRRLPGKIERIGKSLA